MERLVAPLVPLKFPLHLPTPPLQEPLLALLLEVAGQGKSLPPPHSSTILPRLKAMPVFPMAEEPMALTETELHALHDLLLVIPHR
jgi:hypothetical protein